MRLLVLAALTSVLLRGLALGLGLTGPGGSTVLEAAALRQLADAWSSALRAAGAAPGPGPAASPSPSPSPSASRGLGLGPELRGLGQGRGGSSSPVRPPISAQPLRGLNLPNQDGSTNCGAFKPGLLTYEYKESDLDRVLQSNFTALRIPLNVPTAHHKETLLKVRHYIDRVGGQGVLGMWEQVPHCKSGHGDGLISNVSAWASAWKSVHEVFADYPGVLYEVFNEPHGFGPHQAKTYVGEMLRIIEGAGLPHDRCILGGTGFEDSIRAVALHWDGALGYHFYPGWVSDEGNQTEVAYSRRLQHDLKGLSSRVYITEFGAALDQPNPDYKLPVDGGHPDENCLRGLEDGLAALRMRGEPVRGAFHWHGWMGSHDSYDFFKRSNSNGAHKVQSILQSLSERPARTSVTEVMV